MGIIKVADDRFLWQWDDCDRFKQDGMIDLGKGQVEDLCEDHILLATVVSHHRGWQPWCHYRTLWA